jgi:hypothetical protein
MLLLVYRAEDTASSLLEVFGIIILAHFVCLDRVQESSHTFARLIGFHLLLDSEAKNQE